MYRYLCSRGQVVEIQNHTANEVSVSVGFPQVSALGPLLFLLHVNDLSTYHDILTVPKVITLLAL